MLDKKCVVKPLNFYVVPQEKKKKKEEEMVILKLKMTFGSVYSKLFMSMCTFSFIYFIFHF